MQDLHIFENTDEFIDFMRSFPEVEKDNISKESMSAVFETVTNAKTVIGVQNGSLVKIEDGNVSSVSYPELRGMADKRIQCIIEDLDGVRKQINNNCDKNIPCNVCLAFRNRNKILREKIDIGT